VIGEGNCTTPAGWAAARKETQRAQRPATNGGQREPLRHQYAIEASWRGGLKKRRKASTGNGLFRQNHYAKGFAVGGVVVGFPKVVGTRGL
jgi:hypothetical protein